jgi:hypothetical protein
MAYPIPFAAINEVIDIAVEAEELGYHEVAAPLAGGPSEHPAVRA